MNDDNNNNDIIINKEVKNAIECLRKTLLKYLNKYNKYDDNDVGIPNEMNRILLQMKYCLCTLKKQIISLQCLIQCLIKRLHPVLLQQIVTILSMKTSTTTNDNSNIENKKQKLLGQLFQHIFLQIVRIQDSIILCVSGECRHQGNKKIVLKERKIYPYTTSKLGTATNNNNESTSSILYNPNHIYSGTSWDEYMDHHVGIKTRLIKVLQSCTKKKKITWDRLNESGTAPLENIVNDIEIQMKYCKDTFIQYCKNQFIKDIKHIILQKFQNAVSFQADLILTDKLEKMNIKILQNSTSFQFICSLERYGNKFQINDIYGVLPLHYITIDHWRKDNIMKIPQQQHDNNINDNNNSKTSTTLKPTKTFKRLRRAIEDSDDDDDNISDNDQNLFHNNNNDLNNIKSSKSNNVIPNNNIIKENGLVVKFQKQDEEDITKNAIDVSVNAIKEQLGIDTRALEASRENVEAEEALTLSIYDDNEGDDNENDDNVDIFLSKKKCRIENAMLRMKRLEKFLKKQINYSGNLTFIWDARESLREVIMETGNILLWSKKHDHNDYYDPISHSCNQKNNNNYYYYVTIRDWIIQSIQHFCNAKVLVMDQQKQLLNTQKMIDNDENTFLERNLLLLNGRAITNAGIGYIELFTIASYIDVSDHISSIITASNESSTMNNRKSILLMQAIKCFDEAIKNVEELQSKCQNELVETNKYNSNQEIKKTKSTFEIKIDLWKGKELMSLTHRWKAIALWYLSKFNDSYRQFHLAASCCKKADNPMNNNNNDDESDVEVDHAQLDCQIECYYAWTQLSDLCMNSLQRGTVHLIRTNTKIYDTIFEYVTNGLHLASNMSTSIHQSFMKLNGYTSKDNYHIKSSNELLQGLDEIMLWWKQKKSNALKQLSSITNTTMTTVGPIDIIRSDLYGEIPKLPTKLYTFYEGSSSNRQRSKNGIVQKNRNHNKNVSGNMNNNKENSTNHVIVQKQTYRKWGDELLPHQEIDPITGIMKPKLIYPSIAPSIPDEMKLLYEQYLERKQRQNG